MSQDCLPWNSDCLNVVTLLATAFDTKKLKRLSRRFGLYEKGADPDIVDLFQRFHEMCHRDVEFARSIGKDFDDRFRSTVHRVRSSKPEEVVNLKMDWPVPLIWATLTDEREQVRLHARRLLHGLLWNVLHRLSSLKNDDDPRDSIRLLEGKVRVQATELAGMRKELHEKRVEAERLKGSLRSIECRHSGIERAESGQGRLKREIRKLQHELQEEREKARAFLKIMEEARLFPPASPSSGAPDEEVAGNYRECPFDERELPAACREHCGNTNELCDRCPLQGQRVAVIGGICRMMPVYRKVVRDLGAELLFHDGEVKNGSHRLKGLVCGADIVVFVTSVNSHGALNAVKDVCRRNGKKFIALKETGAESLGKKLRLAVA